LSLSLFLDLNESDDESILISLLHPSPNPFDNALTLYLTTFSSFFLFSFTSLSLSTPLTICYVHISKYHPSSDSDSSPISIHVNVFFSPFLFSSLLLYNNNTSIFLFTYQYQIYKTNHHYCLYHLYISIFLHIQSHHIIYRYQMYSLVLYDPQSPHLNP